METTTRSMARFQVEQRVKVAKPTTGFVTGAIYTVEAVDEKHTFAGNFITYQLVLHETGEVMHVNNGHLLLTEVEDEEICENCEEYVIADPRDHLCPGCIAAMKEIDADNKRIEAARAARGQTITVMVERFAPTRVILVKVGISGANEREVSARLYLAAAELERKAIEAGAKWAVSPRAWRGELDVELTQADDLDIAEAIVRGALKAAGLVVA